MTHTHKKDERRGRRIIPFSSFFLPFIPFLLHKETKCVCIIIASCETAQCYYLFTILFRCEKCLLLGGVDRCLKTTTAAVGAVAIQAQSNVRDIDSDSAD